MVLRKATAKEVIEPLFSMLERENRPLCAGVISAIWPEPETTQTIINNVYKN